MLAHLLRMVAEDVIANVLMVCVEKNCIYHPYHGGADIVLESERVADKMKKMYADWILSHPEKL